MSTLRISISFEHEPIELNILSNKLTWSNLVTFIDSMRAIETPVTLYYRKESEGEIETLQTQDQLDQLLIPDIKGLRFYAQKELVTNPVYILPANAFVTLTQFVDKNKSIIASSHRLARSIGMLAFFIAQDTTENRFEYEFEVLENLVTRKLNKSKCREKKRAEETGDEQQQEEDPRETLFGERGSRHFGGHHFGGRGGHNLVGRGGRHFGGRGGFGSPGHHFGGSGGHGRHFGGHGGPSDSFNGPFSGGRGEHFGNDGPFGGRGKHFGRGGKHGGGGYTFSDTEELDPSNGFRKHARGFYERHGLFGKHDKLRKYGRCRKFDSSSEETSSEDEKLAQKIYLLKKLQRNKCFKMKDNRFYFA
ncbi:hypothetical protein MFLAVUS_009504 [Mucor flavus]|uniref:Uncharacterized protein n=1 Tax=Mucor flavus TaxID=439312 RepID=A0ABP9ZA55_9FUNG